MDITLDFQTLTKIVKRSLSIIGKRSVDADGNLLFKDITLGSMEEPILVDFFKEAVIQLKTQTDQFLAATTESNITLTFPSNHPDNKDTTIRDAFSSYCVSYALYSWFIIVAPKIAQKYLEDANTHMKSFIRLAYFKAPPESDESYNNVTGSINPI